jgi:hypothetical protein
VGEDFFFFCFFGCFWPFEAKIQNEEWILFCQKFYMIFSSILQNDGPKPKIFWVKWVTKHTLRASIMAGCKPAEFPLVERVKERESAEWASRETPA